VEGELCRGRVKFFLSEKGWGGIESEQVPGDVWVHFSVIDGDGYRELTRGEAVQFRYMPREQDSWRYVATWVRRLPSEPAGSR
jgi:CspA family cold shock protein